MYHKGRKSSENRSAAYIHTPRNILITQPHGEWLDRYLTTPPAGEPTITVNRWHWNESRQEWQCLGEYRVWCDEDVHITQWRAALDWLKGLTDYEGKPYSDNAIRGLRKAQTAYHMGQVKQQMAGG